MQRIQPLGRTWKSARTSELRSLNRTRSIPRDCSRHAALGQAAESSEEAGFARAQLAASQSSHSCDPDPKRCAEGNEARELGSDEKSSDPPTAAQIRIANSARK